MIEINIYTSIYSITFRLKIDLQQKKISWGLSHDKITTSNKLNNSQRGILVTL